MTLIKDTDLQAQIEELRADIAFLRQQLSTGVGVPDYRDASSGDVLKIVSSYPAWGTPALVSVNVSAPITSTGGTSPTIGHANSGVSAGSYTNANITVNALGHITAASDGSASVNWGSIGGTLSSQTDLNSALSGKGGLSAANTWTGNQNTFSNAIGGTYGGQFRVHNSSGGATNPYKYFRLSPTGTMEIVNSAYSSVIFQFTDTGGLTLSSLSLPGTTSQYVRGDGSIATFPGGGVSSVAAGAGMNFSTITSSGSVVMGTPSTCTASTSNSASGSTHTHAITGFMPTTGGTFSGAITAPGVTDSSDAKHKRNVRRLADGMKIVRRLMPVHFHNLLTDQDEIGLIAQQVRGVLPEVVTTDDNGDLAVSYQRIVAPLIDAVQMLDARLRALE